MVEVWYSLSLSLESTTEYDTSTVGISSRHKLSCTQAPRGYTFPVEDSLSRRNSLEILGRKHENLSISI